MGWPRGSRSAARARASRWSLKRASNRSLRLADSGIALRGSCPRIPGTHNVNFSRACLAEADAVDQVLKARIVTEGIKVRMNLKPLQNVRVLLVTLFKPSKCLLLVTES